jgi:hypothetical protein
MWFPDGEGHNIKLNVSKGRDLSTNEGGRQAGKRLRNIAN